MPTPRPAALTSAAVLVGYLIAALLLTSALWSDPQGRTIGGGTGDPALFLWFLASTSSALWHHGGSGLLVSHLMNAPTGVNVLWNTSLLLPGALLSPLTEAFGPVLTLNVLLLLGPALSAWSAYACSGRVLRRTSSRVVTGLVFGFSPALLSAELGHLHLTLLPLVPPLLLAVVDAATGRRTPVRAGLLLGVLVAAQLLVGEEVLALTAVTAVVLLGVLAVQHRHTALSRVRPLLVTSGVALAAVLVLDGWVLLAQFTGPLAVHGSVQPQDVYVLDPVALAVPDSVPLWPLRLLGPVPWLHLNDAEDMAYLGLPLLLLLVVVVLRRRTDVRVRAVAATAVVLGVLALGPTLHLAGGAKHVPMWWGLTSSLPVLGSLLPVRLMLLVDLLVALLLGLWLDTSAPGRGRVLAAGAVAVALVPLVPHSLDVVLPTEFPAWFRAGAPGLRGTVLLLPFPRHHDATPMAWQAEAGMGFSIAGGFFIGPHRHGTAGFDSDPPRPSEDLLVRLTQLGPAPADTPEARALLRSDLAFWGARTVVLGPCRHQAAGLAFLTTVLGAAPERHDDVYVWPYATVAATPP